MELRNLTPFPHLLFESVDEDRDEFGVAVLSGSFDIGSASQLLVSEVQEEITIAEEYFGEPNESSIKRASSLAPMKLSSDIHINASAHSPSGKPEKRWNVKIEVGAWQKEIHVTGPRTYDKTAKGWELSEPIEVMEVPLDYEKAYGGLYQEKGKLNSHPQNFIGVGHYDTSEEKETWIAPQIVSVDDPNPKFGEKTKVEGVGAIAPTWQPRVKHAGTYDDDWLENVWPYLPADFEYEFWNSAHPDLVMPEYLKGDEAIKLHHLSSDQLMSFALPGYHIYLLCRMKDGSIIKNSLNLDTVHIDAPTKKVFLTWRGVHPPAAPIRVLELRIQSPEDQETQT